MYFGVQYYPEHWPEARWVQDVEMMQRAGVNTVRMGEFAWSALEPQEGQYEFGWMDRALKLLQEHGIRTILCTCSRTPPPWVFRKYPEIRNVDREGHRVPSDGRYAIGISHPRFVALSQRIDRQIIERYAGHEAVVAWQIDNEVGSWNDCYCDDCLERFRGYLRQKFGSVEQLNESWGKDFWSFRISDFADIPRPSAHPQLKLEYRRFLSSLNIDFAAWRAELIHQLDPGKPVTTNFQSFGATHTDYDGLVKTLDLPGMNHYPARSPEFLIDYHRGEQAAVWVLEQFTRLGTVDAGPGWMRLWAYLAIAHGAMGINFFRWRQSRWGSEQFGDGLLPHSGKANWRYQQLAQMGKELQQIGDLIDKTQPQAQAAVLLSYESRWAIQSQTYGLPSGLDPAAQAIQYHTALMRRNVTADAMDPRRPLSQYQLVIAPALFVVDKAIAANLKQYVQHGGWLLLTAGSGVVDEFGKSFDNSRPGPLAEIAGVAVDDLFPLEEPALLASQEIKPMTGCRAVSLADEIQPVGAEVLATYATGWRKGTPAITSHPFGEGQVMYAGCMLNDEATRALVSYLCEKSGVSSRLYTPEGVSAYERRGDDLRLLFLLNHTKEPQRVSLPESWQDAFTEETLRDVLIHPADVRVLRSS